MNASELLFVSILTYCFGAGFSSNIFVGKTGTNLLSSNLKGYYFLADLGMLMAGWNSIW